MQCLGLRESEVIKLGIVRINHVQVGISLSACFSKAPYVAPSLNSHLEGLWFAETSG